MRTLGHARAGRRTTLGTLLLFAGALLATGPAPAAALASPPTPVGPEGWSARFVASTTAVSAAGVTWLPDASIAVGGSLYTSGAAIGGTSTPALFQHQRYNTAGYRIPVPVVGAYRVTFQDAELFWSAAGRRQFTVAVEGSTVEPRLDVLRDSGGKDRALTRTWTTTVTDGVLTLDLRRLIDQTTVTSVEVEYLPPTVPGQMPVQGLFTGPASVFGLRVGAAPISSDSGAAVADLSAQVASRYGGWAAFNVRQYNTAWFEAGPAEPRVDVRFDDCQQKGFTPRGLTGPGGQFTDVPIPEEAVPSAGTDASLSVYQPSTDTLWSFWRFVRGPTGVSACWGGRIEDVSTSAGFWTNGFGTSASGLSHEGGAIGIREAQVGVIRHALSLGVVDIAAAPRLSWPAQRTDGRDTDEQAIAMGTRFRLDPAVDVASLPLHPLARMVAKAAQDYGLIVTDSAGAVSVSTESGEPTRVLTGTNPWDALLAGTPSYAVLRDFPWDRLQALPADYGRPVAGP